MTPALRTVDLACGNGGDPVVSNVSISVPTGSSLALVGPNGAGKSTLIRALAGLRAPVRGRVEIDGRDLATVPARQRGRMISIVSQDEQPNEDLLVGELVALGLTPYRNPWSGYRSTDRDAVVAALETVELAHLVDRPIHQTSGGELRRVILARALLQGAPLLFLDEPTNHLDVEQQLSLLGKVMGLGRTVVAAIHDLDLAAAFFDQVAVIHDGFICDLGDPLPVMTGRPLREAFRISVTPVTHPETGAQHLLLDSLAHPRRLHNGRN